MPELPEVETICRGIAHNIIGKKIIATKTSDKKLRLPFPPQFSINLQNQTIVSVQRRARYILINLSSKKVLLIHLGMSGKLVYHQKWSKELFKHDHCLIEFSDSSALIYNDPRRFGLIDLVDENSINKHAMIKNLGPEPLSDEFDHKYLQNKLRGKKINIKTAMMDNAIVVGVGNIYINESLFASKISPKKSAGNLELLELKKLVKNIKIILQKAIESGGSTLRDYVQLSGDVGEFQFDFKVYGRDNQDCVICASKIVRIKQNGRSSFYCASCQSS